MIFHRLSNNHQVEGKYGNITDNDIQYLKNKLYLLPSNSNSSRLPDCNQVIRFFWLFTLRHQNLCSPNRAGRFSNLLISAGMSSLSAGLSDLTITSIIIIIINNNNIAIVFYIPDAATQHVNRVTLCKNCSINKACRKWEANRCYLGLANTENRSDRTNN